MAMFRNVMVYLGLGPDDEYDENYLYDEDNVDFEGLERRTGYPRRDEDSPADDLGVGAVRPLRSVSGGRPANEPSPFDDIGSPSQTSKTAGLFDGAGAASGSVVAGAGAAAAAAGASAAHPSAAGLTESSISSSSLASTENPSFGGDGSSFSEGLSESHDSSSFQSDTGASNVSSFDNARTSTSQTTETQNYAMDTSSYSNDASSAKPHTVTPQTFDDAAQVADAYAAGSPVAMNLRSCDKEAGRRLLDFTSGMVYGLGGGMEKIAPNVFLITPAGVSVSGDDLRRLEERGFGH